MIEYAGRMDLFPTPVWRYKLTEFDKIEEPLVRYLAQDSLYFTDRERNGVQTTEGDLHKDPEHIILKPIRDFFQVCFEDVMDKMGYEKSCGITGMWATRQKQGGYHHKHMHRNCFLVGVFFMFDIDNNAQGTNLFNVNSSLHMIQPRMQKGKQEFLNEQEVLTFEKGSCIIFPGWVPHSTLPSPSKYRIIIGANSMPIGKANSDHYDQYEFPDPADMKYFKLSDHLKNGYSK